MSTPQNNLYLNNVLNKQKFDQPITAAEIQNIYIKL